MSPDRDVVAARADVAPALAVWLAGPAARPRFDASVQAPEDLVRWRQIVNPRRREEWEVSRALLAHVRRSLGAVAPDPAGATRAAATGTPAIDLAPAASARTAGVSRTFGLAEGTRVSLSHSGGYAAVAASEGALRVGVDLEHARPRDVTRVARFAFSAEELAQLEALPADERPERFYILWTLKEAFAKALSLPLLSSLGGCRFAEERGAWRGDVPASGPWVARVFRLAPTLVLSAVALLPDDVLPEKISVSTNEWPEEGAFSWHSLATLHSRST
jgi:hypothetical protein